MPEAPSANMALVLPTEGSDAGDWDRLTNDALTLVDSHDHTTGRGVRVPTAGMRINADLTFADSGTYYAAKDVKAVDFQPQASSAMSAYAGALFVNSSDSNNLYFRTQAGANVRITNGSTLDLTVVGGIGGDYAAIPAELNFVDASKEYTFRSTAAGNWSRLHAGGLRLGEFGTTESQYVEIAAPATLPSSYTITPASALPGSTSLVQVSSAGQLSYSNTVANAVTFSGLVTASAGVTASANQHVAVSGTGRFKHGNRTVVIGAHEFMLMANTPVLIGGVWTLNSNSEQISGPLRLEAGRRIRSFTFSYNRTAGDLSISLSRASGGSPTSVGGTSVTTGTGWTTGTVSSIDHVVLASNQYYFDVFVGNTPNIAFEFVEVTFDEP